MAMMVIGVNHKTAPVNVRERLAFPESTLIEALHRLRHAAVEELVILSTCNRVECYLQAEASERAYTDCLALFAGYHQLPEAEVVPHLYQFRGIQAIQHLFRVSSGLDSMILGEPQILGQVKAAYLKARDAGCTGAVFQQLFERALHVAKKVRSRTDIGAHAVSVGYAAVELAKKIFERLEPCTVLIVGAGETAELAARHFVRQGVGKIVVTNRTTARAVDLAHTLQATAVPWTALADALAQADIVLSSTSAPRALIRKAMVQECMRVRNGRPMFLIDIAVPRDIEPAVGALDNVFLYDIDDLHNVVEANRDERQRAACAAEQMIHHEVQQFQQWLAARAATPTIVALRQQAEQIRRSECDKALAKLGFLGEPERQAVEALTCAIVNKLLHPPTVNLKRAVYEGRVLECVELIQTLFDLECDPSSGLAVDRS